MESMREYGDALPYGVIPCSGCRRGTKRELEIETSRESTLEKCLFCTSHIIFHLSRILL